MRRFYKESTTGFKFKKIKHKTEKAILFEIEHNVLIWVPKSWVISIKAGKFNVKHYLSSEVRLKIKAEKDAR